MNLIFFILGVTFSTGVHFTVYTLYRKHRRDIREAHKRGRREGFEQGRRRAEIDIDIDKICDLRPPFVPSDAFSVDGTLTKNGKTYTQGNKQSVMQEG